eukprot:IDg7721t1
MAADHRLFQDLRPDSKVSRKKEDIFKHLYRASHRARDFVSKEIDKMLKEGVIQPSKSEWTSPVVVFISLDANWGYWQTPMAPESVPKTAFTCHKGLFEFVRMPFGLMNAPATFRRAPDIILAGYKWQTCLVYLDDVIVFLQNYDDHLAATRCLKNVRQPTTPTELRSFLGLRNVYCRFVRNYKDIAAPLYRLLKENPLPKELEPFSDIEEAAYKTLIKSVTEPPVLALTKPGLLYSIDTDACIHQVGYTLFQTYENNKR